MRSTRYSAYVLGVLLSVYVMNQWDRYLFNYMSAVSIPHDKCPAAKETDPCYQPKDKKQKIDFCTDCTAGVPLDNTTFIGKCCACYIDNDLPKYNLKAGACISETEYGILAGFAFAALFAFSGLFAGRLTDLYNRKAIITVALLFWSAATVCMGFANSFLTMLACRLALGVGQAFSAPPSYSLIADYFPADKRATANGIFSFGIYVGGGLSSLTIVLASAIGWREATYSIGFVGVGIAVVLFCTVQEPAREKKQQVAETNANDDEKEEKRPTTVEALKEIMGNKIVVVLFIASGLRFFGGLAIGSYLPTFYHERWVGFSTQYSVINAAAVSIGGAISASLGGIIADKWSKKTKRAYALIPAIGAFMGIIPFAVCLFANNFYVSIMGLFFEYLFAECWFGPALAILQMELSPKVRGTGVAMYLFFCTMIGNIAPAVIGVLEDYKENLQWYLMVSVLFSYGGCGLIFLLLAGMMSRKEVGDDFIALREDGEESDEA